jgi:hypothetical protein
MRFLRPRASREAAAGNLVVIAHGHAGENLQLRLVGHEIVAAAGVVDIQRRARRRRIEESRDVVGIAEVDRRVHGLQGNLQLQDNHAAAA